MTQYNTQADMAADILHQALRTRTPIKDLPAACRPHNPEQAYLIQRAFAGRLGAVRGWKVGAANPQDEPRYAPLAASLVHEAPASLALGDFNGCGVEAEIAFRLNADLPRRAMPYEREEVLAAVGTVHSAMELVDSRFTDSKAVSGLCKLADLQFNGFFLLGPGVPTWRHLDLMALEVVLQADGVTVATAIGGNPAGDPLRLLHWLANALAARDQGLRDGDIVTAGSCTGIVPATMPATYTATFESLGSTVVALTA